MTQRVLAVLMIAVLALTFGACKSEDTTGPTKGTGVLTGVVRDAVTTSTLSGVTITGDSPQETKVATTGTDGSYSLSFTLDSSATVRVTLQK
jgi:hypothetical protein